MLIVGLAISYSQSLPREKAPNRLPGGLQILRREPVDVSFLAEPGQLPFGEAASCSNGLLSSLFQRYLTGEMRGQLPISDRLERRVPRAPPTVQQLFHLPNPPGFNHAMDPVRDAIVQEPPLQGQSDADRFESGSVDGRIRMPFGQWSAGRYRHLQGPQNSLGVA